MTSFPNSIKLQLLNFEIPIIHQFQSFIRFDRIVFGYPRGTPHWRADSKVNRYFIRLICASAAVCVQPPDGEMHFIMNRNKETSRWKSHFDLWKVNEIKYWIQIAQITIDAETLSNDLFPGYAPRRESGREIQRQLPLICTMKPDFERWENDDDMRHWHGGVWNDAFHNGHAGKAQVRKEEPKTLQKRKRRRRKKKLKVNKEELQEVTNKMQKVEIADKNGNNKGANKLGKGSVKDKMEKKVMKKNKDKSGVKKL